MNFLWLRAQNIIQNPVSEQNLFWLLKLTKDFHVYEVRDFCYPKTVRILLEAGGATI